jgi:murein L,D-transpeptidase YafK
MLAVCGVAVLWANWPMEALPEGTRADLVVVRKGERELALYSGSVLIRSYHVSLGHHPEGAKAQQGDGRTPEGEYRLDYRNLNSGFHRALHVSYPNAKDQAVARSHGVDPGGMVMIHGIKNHLGWIGRAHRWIDWTDGCIAVTNPEIEEIVRVVPDGTPVRIEP